MFIFPVLTFILFIISFCICCFSPRREVQVIECNEIIVESHLSYMQEKENRFQTFERIQCNENCPICLEDINEEIYKIPCNHYFHKKCLYSACDYNYNCPICRQNILLEKNTP